MSDDGTTPASKSIILFIYLLHGPLGEDGMECMKVCNCKSIVSHITYTVLAGT